MLGYGQIHDVSADILRATGWDEYQERSTRHRQGLDMSLGDELQLSDQKELAWLSGARLL